MKVKVSGTSYNYYKSTRRITKEMDISYLNILFPGDVVSCGDKIYVVKHIVCYIGCSYYENKAEYKNPAIYYPGIYVIFYSYNLDGANEYPQPLIPAMVLKKRPFFNWFRFLRVLITRKYK